MGSRPFRRRLIVLAAGVLAAGAVVQGGPPAVASVANPSPTPPPARSVQLAAPRIVHLKGLPPPTSGTHPSGNRPFLPQDRSANQVMIGRQSGVVAIPNGQPAIIGSAAPQTQQQLAGFPVMDLSRQVGLYGADQNNQPPDTQLAAGTTYLVEADNSALSVWTKSGTLVASADLNVFFSVPAGFQAGDPRILYDAESSRWFLSGLAFNASNDSKVYLAVSSTSDPTGAWTSTKIKEQTAVVFDQPMIGINTDKLVISWNDYTLPGSAFSGEETWVLQKSDLISGAVLRATAFGPDTTRFRLVPAHSLAPTATEWLAYNNASCPPTPTCNKGSPTVGVVAITGTPAAGNVLWMENDPALQPTHAPPSPRQQSGVPVVASPDIDDRFLSAVWQGGMLWMSGNDSCLPTGDSTTRSCMRLVKISTSGTPTVAQDFDAGLYGVDLYYPAVTLNSFGDLFIAYTESSSNIFPSAMAVDSLAASPTIFENVLTLAPGLASYQKGTTNRWGDYSAAAQDPSNPAHVWVTAEYQANATTAGNWGTATGRMAIKPAITSVSPNIGSVAGGTSVTITGRNFQTGATVSFGSNPATNVVVVSGTQITATTPAGSAGPVNVTVSNPDTTAVTAPSAYTYYNLSAYTAVAPVRLMDTRNAGGPLGPGGTRNLTVAGGSPGAPAGATAVVVNVTVTNTTAPSYLTVFPAGASQPVVSNLNYYAGTTIPNLVSVQVGSGGAITFFNAAGSADVVVDLEGYYAAPTGSAGGEVALPPARITDTRVGSGLPNAGRTLGPAGSLNVQVTGAGGVPASGVSAVILNVTVTNTTAPSWLAAWPKGAPLPLASNLDWPAGVTIPNRVFVPIGSGGQISLYNDSGSVDVIIDVSGYFTDGTATGKLFYPLAPIRIKDTRASAQTLSPAGSLTIQIGGVAGVPSSARAVILNVTVTNTTASAWLVVYPSTGSLPLASDLDWVGGKTIPNLVVATLGSTGAITFYNSDGSTDVVVDLAGWYG